jgi:putative membrane protein
MAVHIFLMSVVAPLLAVYPTRRIRYSSTAPGFLWTAAIVQIAALWAAHIPGIFNAIATHALAKIVSHGVLFTTALAFWIAVLRLSREQRWAAVLALLITGKLSCLLGVLLIFSQRTLYVHAHGAGQSSDLTALSDQHLAGLLMIAGCPLSYVLAALVITVQLVDPSADTAKTRHARPSG